MPIEKSMQTIKDFYNSCRMWRATRKGLATKRKGKDDRFDIRKKASNITFWRKKIIEDEDEDGDIYRKITCSARDNNGTGREHTLEMLFYGPGEDENTKAAVNCSCEFYMYACEMGLANKGSARIEEPIEMRIWSNGEWYTENGPNPKGLPIICKHVYAALMSGAAKWKPSGLSLENKRKIAQKREKEEKQKERTEREKARKEKEQKRRAATKPAKTEKPATTTKKPPEIKKPPAIKGPPPSKLGKT